MVRARIRTAGDALELCSRSPRARAVPACADPLPFAPSLSAGSTSPQAEAFTSFTSTFSREDGNQNLSTVQLHLPAGLLGKLSAVTPCGEPQASLWARVALKAKSAIRWRV